MNSEDITKANTRKEMNDIAKKLDIKNPKRFSNKSELAEEMIAQIKEQGIEKELDDKFKDIKDLLRKARETGLNFDEYKEGIKKFREAKKRFDYPEAVELSEFLIEQGENIIQSKKIIDDTKEEISKLPQGEIKKSYMEDIKKLINGFKEGEYGKSLVEVKELLDDVQKHNELKKELESQFPAARKKLSSLRKVDIDIEKHKMLLNDTVKALKSGRYKEGLEKIEEFLKRSETVLDISKKIEGCKENIRYLKKSGSDINHYLRVFKTAKKKADSGEYQYSLELLKELNEEMEQDISEVEEISEDIAEEELEETEPENKIEENIAEIGSQGKVNAGVNKTDISDKNLENVNRRLDDLENHLIDIKELLRKIVEE